MVSRGVDGSSPSEGSAKAPHAAQRAQPRGISSRVTPGRSHRSLISRPLPKSMSVSPEITAPLLGRSERSSVESQAALGYAEAGSAASGLFGQTFWCSARSAGPRYLSATAIQPHASQAISRSAAFTARRVRAASPAGQSCSSNSRTAQRSCARSQRRPQTPHDATPGLSSASSAASRRFALPQATQPTLPAGRNAAPARTGPYRLRCLPG
jgi:hypothetical protein